MSNDDCPLVIRNGSGKVELGNVCKVEGKFLYPEKTLNGYPSHLLEGKGLLLCNGDLSKCHYINNGKTELVVEKLQEDTESGLIQIARNQEVLKKLGFYPTEDDLEDMNFREPSIKKPPGYEDLMR